MITTESVPATTEAPALPPGPLTGEQVRRLREDGFLAIDRVASAEEVALIRRTVEALFAAKAGYQEGAHFNFAGADDDPDAPSLPQIISPHNYAASLRKTQFYKQAEAMARQVLGPEVRFGGDHTLNKPPINGPATPWHQDEAFRNPDYYYEELSFWMPLQEVNDVNGCMRFVAGSQERGILPHRALNNDPRVHVLECYEGFDPATATPCPLPAGGCTIHTGRTLHGAGPNRSDAPRLAYVLNFAMPPRRAEKTRPFPWLDAQDTAREQRMRAWMRRGGVFVETWRLIKRTEPRDYAKLLAKLSRKALLLRRILNRQKKA